MQEPAGIDPLLAAASFAEETAGLLRIGYLQTNLLEDSH